LRDKAWQDVDKKGFLWSRDKIGVSGAEVRFRRHGQDAPHCGDMAQF
jgi:hypothetical protein